MTWHTGVLSFAFDGSFLAVMFIGATTILATSLMATWRLRSQSAALRHRVWSVSMIAVLALPILMIALPDLGPDWGKSNQGERDRSIVSAAPTTRTPTIMTTETATGKTSAIGMNEYEAHSSNQPTSVFVPSDGSSSYPSDSIDSLGNNSNRPKNASSANVTNPPLPSSIPWRSSLVATWLIGAAWSLFLFLRNHRAAQAIMRRASPVTHVDSLEHLSILKASIGLNVPVQLVCSSEVSVPFTLGCRKPIIALPAGHGRWSNDRWRVVLAHELTHIHRHDVLLQSLARLACAVHWCHPLVWYGSRRMRIEREIACDDAVLSIGETADAYAEHLVDVASVIRGASPAPALAVAMANRSTLENRVRSILQPDVKRKPVSRTVGKILLSGTFGLAVALSLLSPASRQELSAVEPVAAEDAAVADDSGSAPAETSETESNIAKPESMTAITGTVVDASDAPTANVTVSCTVFPNRTFSATTDQDGRFQIEIPSARLRGALFIALSSSGAMGYDQLPWEITDTVHSPKIKLAPARKIAVRVFNSDQAVVADATVVIHARNTVVAKAKVNSDGRAVLNVPADLQLDFALAEAPKKGVDYFAFRSPDEPKSDPYQLEQDHSEELTFKLHPPRPLTVRVVDHEGNPVSNASVYPWLLTLPNKGTSANLGAHWQRQTNKLGIVTYDNIPKDNSKRITIWAKKDGYEAEDRTHFEPSGKASEVTAVLIPKVTVSGTVLDGTGQPAKEATVNASGDGHGFHASWRDSVTTDEEGNFQFQVPRNRFCVFAASSGIEASPAETRVVLNRDMSGIELTLQSATRVFGQLTDASSGESVADKHVYCYLDLSNQYYKLPPDEKLPNPKDSRTSIDPRITYPLTTGKIGKFEFHLGPGEYWVLGPPYAMGAQSPHCAKLTITDQREIEVPLVAKPSNKSKIIGRVVLASDTTQGVANVEIRGRTFAGHGSLRATSDASGNFEAHGSDSGMMVGAFTKDNALGAITKVAAGAESMELALSQTASIRGILFDNAAGTTVAGRELQAGVRIDLGGPFAYVFARKAFTNEAGEFDFVGLVPDHEYTINLVMGRDGDGQPRGWRQVEKFTPANAGVMDVGTVTIPQERREFTLEDRISRAYPEPNETVQRIDERLADAKRGYAQILLIIAAQDSEVTRQLFLQKQDYSKGNRPFRLAMGNYYLVGISPNQTDLIKTYGVATPEEGDMNLAILNHDGRLVAETMSTDLSLPDGRLSASKLTDFLDSHHVELPDARKLLADGLARAKAEDKRVIAQISGPKCYPCILLSRYLEEHSALVSKDYVYVKLDSRMRNGDEVIKELRTEGEASIPWTTILSSDGTQLATSEHAEKGNIGFPSSNVEREHFKEMIETTRQRLTDDEVAELLRALEE